MGTQSLIIWNKKGIEVRDFFKIILIDLLINGSYLKKSNLM